MPLVFVLCRVRIREIHWVGTKGCGNILGVAAGEHGRVILKLYKIKSVKKDRNV